jgi:hypothetical protein
MGKRYRDRWLSRCVLSLLFLVSTAQALAFEGDYIWEERFKTRLARAQSGQVSDQYAVANMYFRGRGIEKNASKALRWFLRAAKQGHTKAAYKVGYLYLYAADLAASNSPKQAFPWIQKAAQAGYPPAQYELGRLYFSGKAVERDESQALKWLGRAKSAGYAPARTAFKQTVKRLVEAQSADPKKSRDSGWQKTEAEKKSVRADNQLSRAADLPDPKGIILHSKWGSSDGPSTFLPSKLTRCRESVNGIECLSSELNMQLASTNVVYRTRSRITDIGPEGQFRLAYAHNVLSTDAKTDELPTVAVKTGWQRNEHVLDCSLVAGRTISCAQGTSKQYRFFGRY